jgi:hypothetical protein
LHLTKADKQQVALFFDFGEKLKEEMKPGGQIDPYAIDLEPEDSTKRKVTFREETMLRFETFIVCGACEVLTPGTIILDKDKNNLVEAGGFFVARDNCICDSCMTHIRTEVSKR